MVVKWFNYFQVSALASELSLLCFFDKCDFYPHDSFENQSHVWNLTFETISDALMTSLSKTNLVITGKKIIYIYLWDRNRLEKIVLLSFI